MRREAAFPPWMKLRSGAEFRRVFEKGVRLPGALFLLVAVENTHGHDRLGLRGGLDGRDDRFRFDGHDRSGRQVGIKDGRIEARRLGHLIGHRGEARRVFLGREALEECGHLGFEGGDPGGHLLDAALHDPGVSFQLALELGLAPGDAVLGDFADARDLGLGPFADAGDVLVGRAAR